MENFGAFLRSKREEMGLTCRELAARCGIHNSLIARYENNKVVPRKDKLHRMINVLPLNDDEINEIFKIFRKK